MQAGLRLLPLLLLVIAVASGCESEQRATFEDNPSALPLAEAEVVRVVDGDTIIVLLDGREERVRYIGIDAPESVTPDEPVECFGPEAGDANARLVAGRSVLPQADVEERDRFERLLRYVYIRASDGSLTMVNVVLVAEGYAVARAYPPNERHQDELGAAERRAEAQAAGLWSAC